MSPSKETRKATASDADSELISPGLMESLMPELAVPVSIGTAQNGIAMRGKNIHIGTATGAAYNSRRPPVEKLCLAVSPGVADMRSHAVMMTRILTSRYGNDHRYCSRSSEDMTRKIEMKSSTNWSRRWRVSSSLSDAMTASSADPGPTPLIVE